MARVDLAGRVFGRLTVIRPDGVCRKQSAWLCRCECGAIVRRANGDLQSGNTRSCGCLRIATSRALFTKHGHRPGRRSSPTYSVWCNMHTRCSNPKATHYAEYGGRGISVCDRWSDFGNFLADMGERPLGLTLERIDNELGYSPDNCRWATRMEQSQNQRSNRWLELGPVKMILSDWGRLMGMRPDVISGRIDKSGWSVRDAIMTPVGGRPAPVSSAMEVSLG